jgi:hypothetical protein
MQQLSTEPQKDRAIKIFATIGFIVTLIFIAWLAVQAVRLVPVAFGTLASIATELKYGNQDSKIPN